MVVGNALLYAKMRRLGVPLALAGDAFAGSSGSLSVLRIQSSILRPPARRYVRTRPSGSQGEERGVWLCDEAM